ncbi:MAG: hypothetical protein GXO76_10215 [Calditrichaeota bacterium]|nr:hypothetical protein [Calditrichota bacterium]
MRNRNRILKMGIVFLLLVFAGSLQAQGIKLTGYARNYTGVLLHGNHDFSIIQNTFNLNVEKTTSQVAFKVNPYMYQYPNEDSEHPEIGLREAYLDIYFNSMDLRIGKQQIIWGKADGVFITDIVSPKDLTEFLLRDFDEIRMGVTGVKADYYIGDNTFELVWLPAFIPTKFPPQGSIWFRMPPFPVPLNRVTIDHSREKVTPSLDNSEVFAKFSALTGVVDFEVMAAYAWDDDPTMHVYKKINPQTHQLVGLTVYPEHHRLTIGGGSFSTTLGPFVLRGEGAYYTGKYFNSTDPKLVDGTVKKDYLHYLLGLDYTIFDVHTSVQFIQQAILDYNDYIKNDQYQNMATFLASKTYLNETLDLSFFMYYDFNNQASLIRPKITYSLADGFDVLLGANIFTGSEGMFGQYNDNDMIYTKIKYSF